MKYQHQLSLIWIMALLMNFSVAGQDTLQCTLLEDSTERMFIVLKEHEMIMKTIDGKRDRVMIDEMTGSMLTVRPKYRTRSERKERRKAERAIRKDETLTPAQLREKVEFLARYTTREIPLDDVEWIILFNKYNPDMQKRLKGLSIANMVWLWGGIPALFLVPTAGYILSWTGAGSAIITAYLITERKRIRMDEWQILRLSNS